MFAVSCGICNIPENTGEIAGERSLMRAAPTPDLMTTAEVAAYLRLKERTIYELVRMRRIPCARVSGKWLFPRPLVDLWVAQNVEYAGPLPQSIPPVAAGTHDPLLEWALRESHCDLALLAGGSEDGLRRLAEGKAMLAAIHILDPESGDYNRPAIRSLAGVTDIVLIEWAWREQGLLAAPGNPLGLARIADLASRRPRIARRQEGAGTQTLFRHLVAQADLRYEDLDIVEPPALTQTDLAVAILEGRADCGLGVRAAARRFRLHFIPLHRERVDLAMRRRDYFEPAAQALLAFTRTPAFAAEAAVLGGYDVSATGRVNHNA
jgi:excisionase family DNA binding protein